MFDHFIIVKTKDSHCLSVDGRYFNLANVFELLRYRACTAVGILDRIKPAIVEGWAD